MPRIYAAETLQLTPERHLISFTVGSPINGEFVCDATFCHRKVDVEGNVVEQHNEQITITQDKIFSGLPDAAKIVTAIKEFLHGQKDLQENV